MIFDDGDYFFKSKRFTYVFPARVFSGANHQDMVKRCNLQIEKTLYTLKHFLSLNGDMTIASGSMCYTPEFYMEYVLLYMEYYVFVWVIFG